jgi:hypothetical protein
MDEEQKAVIAGMKNRIPFSPDPRMLAEWLKAEAAENAGEITLMREGWRLQFAEETGPERRALNRAGSTLRITRRESASSKLPQ